MSSKKARRVQPANWAAINGYAHALRKFAKSGDPNEFRGSLISHADMADALHEISLGADAREVFRQSGKTGRQSKGWYHSTLAAVYWRAYAAGDEHKVAVDKARAHFKNIKPPSAASLARIVRKQVYRDHCLSMIERSGVDLTVVRQRLELRSKRGKWD
jgi:hypothetical protein